MSRPDRGSFEELVEHHGERTVPIVRGIHHGNAQPTRNRWNERLERTARENGIPPVLLRGIADIESAHRRIQRASLLRKLRIAGPFLMLLAGLGCLTVSVWPQVLPTVGCALFTISTVWSLVRCVR